MKADDEYQDGKGMDEKGPKEEGRKEKFSRLIRSFQAVVITTCFRFIQFAEKFLPPSPPPPPTQDQPPARPASWITARAPGHHTETWPGPSPQ